MAVWSSVPYRELTEDLRLDAEYYDPNALALRKVIDASPYRIARLEDLAASIINFGAYSLCNYITFQDDGIPFITAENIHAGYIDFSSARHVPEDQHKGLLWKSQVSQGQVLVAMAARLGYAAVYDSPEPLSSSQDVAKVTLADTKATDPYYMAAYINSSLGREQLLASRTGSVQQHTNLGKLKDLKVIVLPPARQIEVRRLFKRGLAERERASSLYAQAEKGLLHELHLDSLDLSPQLTYERGFSEVQRAGRMDPEYYQPKYYRLKAAIDACGFPRRRLGDLVHPIRNGCDIRQFVDNGVPYIRVGDIADGRIAVDAMKVDPADARASKKDIQLRVGDILFTRKGTYGNTAVVRPGQNNAIISSEIMLLRTSNNQVVPEYLAAYLSSPAGYHQVERRVHGVAFYSITQADLASVDVVVASREVQERVQATLADAHSRYAESCRMLDEAIGMVEESLLSGP